MGRHSLIWLIKRGFILSWAYTGQVCAAEQKVLSIKQGVEFYYCSSKIQIIYFIVVKYSILVVNLLKSVVNSVFLDWKTGGLAMSSLHLHYQ